MICEDTATAIIQYMGINRATYVSCTIYHPHDEQCTGTVRQGEIKYYHLLLVPSASSSRSYEGETAGRGKSVPCHDTARGCTAAPRTLITHHHRTQDPPFFLTCAVCMCVVVCVGVLVV
jgi:hypothetical protein